MYLGQNDISLAPNKPDQSSGRFDCNIDDWKKVGSEYEQWSWIIRKEEWQTKDHF